MSLQLGSYDWNSNWQSHVWPQFCPVSVFVWQNCKIQCSETGPRLLLQRLVVSLRETRKTLDNNDLNQVVASSGFSANKGLVGVLSLRAHKTWCRSFLLRIFQGTLRSVISGLFFPCSHKQSQKTLPVSFLAYSEWGEVTIPKFLKKF